MPFPRYCDYNLFMTIYNEGGDIETVISDTEYIQRDLVSTAHDIVYINDTIVFYYTTNQAIQSQDVKYLPDLIESHLDMISAKNEIKDGPDELCYKLDAPSLETNMEICPASALAISATIFGFETSDDCIIFSNMQTDPFTRDLSSFYEIESTTSIGGCVATTAMATTTPTTTTKQLLLADLFGGG